MIRLVNQHFMHLWMQQDPVGRKHRGLISLMRRHHWNLSDQQKTRLAGYLEQYPVLDALYRVKQKLNRLLLIKNSNARKARKWLPKLLRLLDQLKNSPARSLANTLESWLEPIVRMWRISKSNGITEGFHTKMEMISRRAYGFRNFENYRMRVLALCGWNGVINRVWSVPSPVYGEEPPVLWQNQFNLMPVSPVYDEEPKLAGFWMFLDILRILNGASDRNRTGTGLPPRDFKSRASTYFATEAMLTV